MIIFNYLEHEYMTIDKSNNFNHAHYNNNIMTTFASTKRSCFSAYDSQADDTVIVLK